MKRKLLIIFALFIIAFPIFSQNIRGAYIRTAWVPNSNNPSPVYQYSVEVILLTDANIPLQRSTVTVTFSFGETETYSLTSSLVSSNGVIINTYSGTHTFPGPTGQNGYYFVQYLDTFLVPGIKNISSPQTQYICAETRLVANNYFFTKKSGTILNFPPELSVSNNTIIYNPMFISNNDSVSYKINNYCNQNGYYIPNGAILSPTSGVLNFSKDSLGLYLFNISITEWGTELTGQKKAHRTTFADFIIDINTTVEIAEHKKDNLQIKLFPNPNNGEFEVSVKGNGSSLCHYEIYNLNGNVIDFGDKIITVTNNRFNLSNIKLKSGIYFLKVYSSEKSASFKFMIE